MRIDHVSLATADLQQATTRLERELGLRQTGEEDQPHLGTRVLLFGLGGAYLELVAITDRDRANSTELGKAMARNIDAAGEGLMGWAVAVHNVNKIAKRLDLPVLATNPHGPAARMAGVPEAMLDPALPFFVQRDRGVPDPGTEGEHGGIPWIEVAGHETVIRRWLRTDKLPVRIVEGESAVLACGIGDQALRRGPSG